MCHLVLLLPVVALPVFWLLPLGDAAFLYSAVIAASLGTYWLVLQSLRAPVVTGIEALRHKTGTVRSVDGRKAAVWVASELWSAETEPGALQVGDIVEIVGAVGIVLQVRKAGRPRADHTSPSSAVPLA